MLEILKYATQVLCCVKVVWL